VCTIRLEMLEKFAEIAERGTSARNPKNRKTLNVID
jgi:hypothetical protein